MIQSSQKKNNYQFLTKWRDQHTTHTKNPFTLPRFIVSLQDLLGLVKSCLYPWAMSDGMATRKLILNESSTTRRMSLPGWIVWINVFEYLITISVQFLSCESIRIYVRMLFLFILQKVCVRRVSILFERMLKITICFSAAKMRKE